MIILGTNSIKASGFDVDYSCRLDNPGDGASSPDYLTRTPSSAGNRRTFTISYWVKRWGLQTGTSWQQVIGQQISNYFRCGFNSNEQGDIIRMYGNGGFEFRTTPFYRDVSAWYHVCLAIDTTQGTESNRAKLYVNGTQVTSFVTESYPSQNTDLDYNLDSEHVIGRSGSSGNDGLPAYLAQFVSIDGTAYAASDFGEFDEDSPTIWKPKDVSGLTFGSQGFYLDFADAADLGDDESGNTNDFAETGIAAINQVTDTPTNNFATLNPLDNTEGGIATFSEGNCKILTAVSAGNRCRSTVGLTTGKWYVEVKITSAAHLNYQTMGFTRTSPSGPGGDGWFGGGVGDVCYYSNDGKIYNTGNSVAGTAHGATATTGDIIGCFLDLDNNTANFYKNGAQQNSGTGYDISSINGDTEEWFFACGDATSNANTAELELNFGNPTYAPSSAVSDANGYGSFEYTPSVTTNGAAKDYLAICTKNLAEYG